MSIGCLRARGVLALEWRCGKMSSLTGCQAKTEASLNKLPATQAKTEVSLDKPSSEMREFREEMQADRKEMNRKWGELANKWGTVVEDIVAPNVPPIASEYFGFSDIEDFMVRRRVRNNDLC